MEDLSATGIVIFSFALKLVGFVVAAVLVVAVSRILDKKTGFPFSHIAGLIRQESRSTALYYGLRILALCILAAAILGCEQAQETVSEAPAVEVEAAAVPATSKSSIFTDEYDLVIADAVGTWWPDYPYKNAWKAQLYQESRLDPDAVSPVGARGLAQFMPGTWREVGAKLGYDALSPHMVEPAIMAGAYYMRQLRKQWSAPRPQDQRHMLAQASYNAGLGNILAAQKQCGGPNLYPEIIACLPDVTGRHSEETIIYVQRIKKWWTMMEVTS